MRAPVASSTFIPPATAVDKLFILRIDGEPTGVEIIDIPTISPFPDFPTTVSKISAPFNTTTNSPVFCTVTWNVISNIPAGGRVN